MILYKTLKGNTFVVGLDLGYNNIGDEGAQCICSLLQVKNNDTFKGSFRVCMLSSEWLTDTQIIGQVIQIRSYRIRFA